MRKYLLVIKYKYPESSYDDLTDVFCEMKYVVNRIFVVSEEDLENISGLLHDLSDFPYYVVTDLTNTIGDYYDRIVRKKSEEIPDEEWRKCPPSSSEICEAILTEDDEYYCDDEDECDEGEDWRDLFKDIEFEVLELEEDVGYTGEVMNFSYVRDGKCGLCECDLTEVFIDTFPSKIKRNLTWNMNIIRNDIAEKINNIQARILKLDIRVREDNRQEILNKMIELERLLGRDNIKVYKHSYGYYVYAKLPEPVDFIGLYNLRRRFLDYEYRLEFDEKIYQATKTIAFANILYNAKMVEGDKIKFIAEPISWEDFLRELQ